MKDLNQIDLYFITDRKLTKKTITDDVRAAIKAGVKVIQYRDKEVSTKLMLEEAKKIKKECDNNNILFLINDRADICLAVDADGIHLGQDDIPYGIARKLLPNKIIGLTVHNIQEAIEAEKLGADYIGISPIFETKTKLDAGPATGIELIKQIKEKIKIPFVAIGGINQENLDCVLKAGAKSIAIISALITKDNVEEEAKKIISKIKSYQ